MSATPLLPEDPQRLGGYWLAGRVGHGGQGVVYEAYGDDGRRVAIKVLHGDAGDDPELADRFGREAAAARRVAPFCTARVLDAHLDAPRPYIVSEFVEGPSLREAVREGRSFSEDEVYRLGVAVAAALTAIHEAGVVHRDLKPDNVLLGADGPRVIDFGVARTLEMSLTSTGLVRGTPTYMAPEVFTGQRAGTAADVFAWGGVMLFAATGTDPFSAETLGGVMHRVLSADPDLDAVPTSMRSLVAAALSKEADARPSARDLLLALVTGRTGDAGAGTEPLPASGPALLARAGAEASLLAGGGEASLGALAEDAYEALTPAQRMLVPEIFLRLVTAGQDGELVPCGMPLRELLDGRPAGEEADLRRVLEVFGYVLATHDGVLRLARPGVLTAWPRLRAWVEDDRAGLPEYRVVQMAARQWDGDGRRDGDVLHGTRLEAAMRWAAAERRHLVLSPLERSFLDASAGTARRRATRRRLLTAALAVLLVLALSGGGLSVYQSRRIAEQRDTAVARDMVAVAGSLRSTDPVQAMLLNVAAWRVAPQPETRAGLSDAFAQMEIAAFSDPADSAETLRALSRDGRTLVSIGDDAIRVWDLRGRSLTRRIPNLGMAELRLRRAVLSPSGRLLAIGTDLDVTVWELATGRRVARTQLFPQSGLYDFELDFEGQDRYVLVSQGQGMSIWDLRTGRRTGAQAGDAAVDPTGKFMITGFGFDGLQRWSLPDGKLRATKRVCQCPPRVALSPDGQTVFAGYSGYLHRLDSALRPPKKVIIGDGDRWNGGALVPSLDGRLLASVNEAGLQLWRTDDWTLLTTRAISSVTPAAAFDPDGRTLRYLSEDTVVALDVSALTAPPSPIGPRGMQAAFSPDGRWLATHERGTDLIQLREPHTGRPVGAQLDLRQAGDDHVSGMVLSGDGRFLAAYTSPGSATVSVWDTSSRRRVARFAVPGSRVTALDFSADGTRLAVKVADDRKQATRLEVWDPRSGRRQWAVPYASLSAIGFTPDGARIVAVGSGYRVHDAVTGRPLGKAYELTMPAGDRIAFERDGVTMVIADKAARLTRWDIAEGRRVGQTLRGPAETVERLAVSPVADLAAVAGEDHLIHLFDLRSERRLGAPLAVHHERVADAVFTADGTALLSIDDAGMLRETPVDPGRIASAVCRRAGRTLSPAEWQARFGDAPYRDVCAT
ncbi:serine/threonine-protein kinase [Microbispora sp. NPDC049125]|uniref:serine/threonine-protein kinase n=1 Tax=Microbispora sp. NPDC049125 TaxID=3154929 RepID=UPI0034666786